jgi:hypothetical protein
MSRTCSKEVMTDIYDNEIQAQQRLLTAASPKVQADHDAKKLSDESFDAFNKAQTMLNAAKGALEAEDFTKSLQLLIRSVANYYLMLGDKGVLRNVPK